MFRCDKCGRISDAGEKANMVQISRPKTYEEVRYEYDPKKRKNVKVKYETQGFETESELKICKHCING